MKKQIIISPKQKSSGLFNLCPGILRDAPAKELSFIIICLLFFISFFSVATAAPLKEIYFVKKTTLAYPETYTFRFSLWRDAVSTDPADMVWSDEISCSLSSPKVKYYLGSNPAAPLSDVDFSEQLRVQVDTKKKSGDKIIGTRDRVGGAPYALWSDMSGAAGPQGPIGPQRAQGPQGIQGDPGIAGAAGVACWDLNANGLCDLATEDINTDTLCDALDCKGDPGTVNTAGTGIGISNNQINVNLDMPINRHGYFTPGQGARNPRISSIDATGDVGSYSSVTIGTDGLPVISYYDATNGDLKVARCSNPYCLVNWARR